MYVVGIRALRCRTDEDACSCKWVAQRKEVEVTGFICDDVSALYFRASFS